MNAHRPRGSDETVDGVQGTPFHELFARAQSGDADAIAELVDHYRPYLLLIANQEIDSGTRVKTAASDVVQKSMVHAQQGFGNFAGVEEAEFRSWLRAILTNDLRKTRRGFLTQKRNATREVSIQERSAVGRTLVDPMLTPASGAAKNEKMTLLAIALDELSDDHRQVIHLRNFDGLAFDEIGNRMNRGADAACKLWARAIDALRKRLDVVAPGLFDEQEFNSS